jgi:hypothetical protein
MRSTGIFKIHKKLFKGKSYNKSVAIECSRWWVQFLVGSTRKKIKLVFATSLTRNKNKDWLTGYQNNMSSGEACPTADCCFSELGEKNTTRHYNKMIFIFNGVHTATLT